MLQMLALALAFFAWAVIPSAAQQGGVVSDREFLSVIMNERERANDKRFEAQEKATAAALASADKAALKAEAGANERFASQNEFRKTIETLIEGRASTTYVNAKFQALEDKVAQIAAVQIQQQGSTEGAAKLWGIIAGAVGLLIGFVAAALAVFAKLRSSPTAVLWVALAPVLYAQVQNKPPIRALEPAARASTPAPAQPDKKPEASLPFGERYQLCNSILCRRYIVLGTGF